MYKIVLLSLLFLSACKPDQQLPPSQPTQPATLISETVDDGKILTHSLTVDKDGNVIVMMTNDSTQHLKVLIPVIAMWDKDGILLGRQVPTFMGVEPGRKIKWGGQFKGVANAKIEEIFLKAD